MKEVDVAIKVVYFVTALELAWFRWIVSKKKRTFLVNLSSFTPMLDGLIFTGNPILAPSPRADVARVPRGFCCLFFLSALSVFGVNFFHLSYLLKPVSSRWHQHMFATGGIASCLENLNSSGATDQKKKFLVKYMFARLRCLSLKSIRKLNWSNKK